MRKRREGNCVINPLPSSVRMGWSVTGNVACWGEGGGGGSQRGWRGHWADEESGQYDGGFWGCRETSVACM